MQVNTTPNRHLNHAAAVAGADVAAVDRAAGLYYAPAFLTIPEMDDIVRRIDAAEWNTQISRRTQHYGWRYDYRAKAITPDMRLGRLPDFLRNLAQRLTDLRTPAGDPLFRSVPTQCIVNEYQQAQGIAQHTDHRGFGPAIATVSLLEDWEMDLKRQYRDPDSRPALLQAGSALVMAGKSRSVWSHGIQARRSEPDGRRRGRRLSLTFRTVLNHDGPND